MTTGLVPLAIGSVETFQLSARLNGLPWNLTGGSATVSFLGPNGETSSHAATVNRTGATLSYTVVGGEGTWSMCWLVEDASGRIQKSLPILFAVTASP